MPFEPMSELPKGPPPRRPGRQPISAHEAKARATELLREQRISLTAQQVIDALAVAGVLTDSQIYELVAVSQRTLERYYSQHILDRVIFDESTLQAVGLRYKYVATLGAVGQAIAAYRYELVPSGYIGYGVRLVTHDVLAAETMIELLREGKVKGYRPTWLSRYEATVRDKQGKPLLEPDGFVRFRNDAGDERAFVLEYHNEDHGKRARMKVKKYEELLRVGHWQESWGVREWPSIVVAHTYPIVSDGYGGALKNWYTWRNRKWLGKGIKSIINDKKAFGWWIDLHDGTVRQLWEREEEE